MKNILSFIFTLSIISISFSQINLEVVEPPIIRTILPSGIRSKVLLWGVHSTMEDLVGVSRAAEPLNGCVAYTNLDPKDNAEYIYFSKFSGLECSLSTVIHNAQSAGAKALVLEHSESDLSAVVAPDHFHGTCLPLLTSRSQYPSHNDTQWVCRGHI